jgi:hypothetical protein
MARTPMEAEITQHIVTDADTPSLPAISAEVDRFAASNAAIMDSMDAIKAIGRIEMAELMATVASKCIAETFLSMKETKKYKGLPYIDNSGKLATIATLEEYCEHFLPHSYRRCREIAANYRAIGAELFEQAERLGFRQQDYNALKALPADDRQIIAQAIEAEDLSKALDLMGQMAAKHHKEKEDAAIQIADLKGNLGAMEVRLKKKDEKINELDQKLTRKIIDDAGYPQGHQELESLHTETQLISAKVTASLRSRISQLYGAFDGDLPRHLELAAAQSIGLIITAAYELAADLNLSPVLNPETAADDEVQQTLRNMAALEAAGGDPTQFLDEQGRADLARLKGYTQTEIEG